MENQHKQMYSLYISFLCNIAFPMARFTCIVTSQSIVKILMQWSIALSTALFKGRENIYE